jgi:hypothetical protein
MSAALPLSALHLAELKFLEECKILARIQLTDHPSQCLAHPLSALLAAKLTFLEECNIHVHTFADHPSRCSTSKYLSVQQLPFYDYECGTLIDFGIWNEREILNDFGISVV